MRPLLSLFILHIYLYVYLFSLSTTELNNFVEDYNSSRVGVVCHVLSVVCWVSNFKDVIIWPGLGALA